MDALLDLANDITAAADIADTSVLRANLDGDTAVLDRRRRVVALLDEAAANVLDAAKTANR